MGALAYSWEWVRRRHLAGIGPVRRSGPRAHLSTAARLYSASGPRIFMIQMSRIMEFALISDIGTDQTPTVIGGNVALFGRKPAVPQLGILINLAEYQQEMATATRPGIPRDGRYWAALIETNGEISRLIWERAATYQEAKALLKEFERTYGKKPKLASSARVDDVAGVWYVEPRGKPDAVLTISHPVMLRYPAY